MFELNVSCVACVRVEIKIVDSWVDELKPQSFAKRRQRDPNSWREQRVASPPNSHAVASLRSSFATLLAFFRSVALHVRATMTK